MQMNKTEMGQIENVFTERQREICQRFGSIYWASPFNQMIGVAIESFVGLNMPINGLRHPIENEQSTNWYVWAGEYSDNDDFFKPVHVYHLLDLCPKAINYLGLAPGWRFLFDNTYEDVWYDQSLLSV